MIIKKFQGKTSEEALEAAKKELGDNIVFLTDKVVKPKWYQFFKKSYIEVTVAMEEDSEIVAAKQKNDIAEALVEINKLRSNDVSNKNTNDKASDSNNDKEIRGDIEKKSDNLAITEDKKEDKYNNSHLMEMLDEKRNQHNHQMKDSYVDNTLSEGSNGNVSRSQDNDTNTKSINSELEDFINLVYETMIDNEVNVKFANEMIEEVRKIVRNDMDMEYILSQIYQKMILKFGKTESVEPSSGKGPKLIYFIGPTGVGKTTTLAKVASQLSVMKQKKVALFTADTYRIAATDQLKTYASIMEAPFHIIYSVEDMQKYFDNYKEYDYILVDTAGHSHHNEVQRNEMNQFVHAFDDLAEKEVFLVLSATTKYRDLVSIADTYKEMTDYKLIFTKLDETSTYGNLYNLRLHTMASISYVTCGQNVPDDIAEFDPQDTVKKLLSATEE